MLLKLELARGQASLAGWVVSEPVQRTSAVKPTEEVAAQQEQHEQLHSCKKTQRQQDQRDRELSQVQVKSGVVVQRRCGDVPEAPKQLVWLSVTIAMPTTQWPRRRQISCTNSGHLTRRSNSGYLRELA
jgi:hypothetical protein